MNLGNGNLEEGFDFDLYESWAARAWERGWKVEAGNGHSTNQP
jgi:hypothetical protein